MNIAFPALQPTTVLAVAAHPDDIDFCAAGTVAHFLSLGAEVYYLIITDGCKGTSDTTISPEELTAIRQEEQRNALERIGGNPTNVSFLNYCDGELEITHDLKRDIVRAIRLHKPDVVVTMDPSVLYVADKGIINHPDHRAVGQATLDAVFPLARDHLSFKELADEGLTPHAVPTVLLANFAESNFSIDISDVFDKKMIAIEAHPSQMSDLEHVESIITDMATAAGVAHGCTYAETFIRIDVS